MVQVVCHGVDRTRGACSWQVLFVAVDVAVDGVGAGMVVVENHTSGVDTASQARAEHTGGQPHRPAGTVMVGTEQLGLVAMRLRLVRMKPEGCRPIRVSAFCFCYTSFGATVLGLCIPLLHDGCWGRGACTVRVPCTALCLPCRRLVYSQRGYPRAGWPLHPRTHRRTPGWT